MELVVLSINEEDIKDYLDEGTVLDTIEKKELSEEILAEARHLLWDSLDCSNMVSDALFDACKHVFRRHGLDFLEYL